MNALTALGRLVVNLGLAIVAVAVVGVARAVQDTPPGWRSGWLSAIDYGAYGAATLGWIVALASIPYLLSLYLIPAEWSPLRRRGAALLLSIASLVLYAPILGLLGAAAWLILGFPLVHGLLVRIPSAGERTLMDDDMAARIRRFSNKKG